MKGKFACRGLARSGKGAGKDRLSLIEVDKMDRAD